MFSAKTKALGIIPARYGSTRFPGKPLSLIAGKSLIQRTYESAKKCSALSSLVVATDDKRIYDHVVSFGGEAIMTSSDCPTGTDRIVDVLKHHTCFSDASLIVNIQGDEPCIEAEVIQKIVVILAEDKNAQLSTAVVKIKSEEEALNPSVVKCVMDQHQNALYFSRALIPSGRTGKFLPEITYYRHVGIYAYRRDFLFQYSALLQTPLQKAEDLEQLKVLEWGYRIKVAVVESDSIGVDTPEDIIKVEQLLCRQNTSS